MADSVLLIDDDVKLDYAVQSIPVPNVMRWISGLGTEYVVGTVSADADTMEARLGNTGPRDAALASGAPFVSTDYPEPDPRFGTGYEVSFPGDTVARCNPVTAPRGCRAEWLE